ncbi:MAG: hypothetical protein BGO67_07300 [Alphaproteobacteria bacterium 41-28]|nr:MAG: hypothetical protein BGO67_07300 [Alphaproteobacteria bacterium 41-28]
MLPKLIAHRGNTDGPNQAENNPDYLLKTLDLGYDCEVDIWVINGKIFLGHDNPLYSVEEDFIHTPKFWFHAKNLEALDFMLQKSVPCFWHENDQYTLTSNGFIWANIHMPVTSKTIIVVPDIESGIKKIKELPYGICSDYVSYWQSDKLAISH